MPPSDALQWHLNTTLLITNIPKILLINGAGVVRGVEWYETTKRKRRGIRGLKGVNRDKNHKTAAVQKS